MSGVEGLPAGSALLVVKRGPNAGSRFLLDQADHPAGRHPDSDIFLDDVTVSRRHAEFRRTAPSSRSSTSAASTAPTSTASRSTAVLANGDEVQIGKFRLVFLTGPEARRRRRGIRRLVSAADSPALAGMSIGAVLDLLRPDFPDVTISKIRFLRPRAGHAERAASGYRQVHRVRLRAAAFHPHRAAGSVPAAEGDQGAAGRPARRRAAAVRIAYGVPRLVSVLTGGRRRTMPGLVRPGGGGAHPDPAEPRGSAGPLRGGRRAAHGAGQRRHHHARAGGFFDEHAV